MFLGVIAWSKPFRLAPARALVSVTMWWGPGIQPSAILLTWALELELWSCVWFFNPCSGCFVAIEMSLTKPHWSVNARTGGLRYPLSGFVWFWVGFFCQIHFNVQCCYLQLDIFIWHCPLPSNTVTGFEFSDWMQFCILSFIVSRSFIGVWSWLKDG